MNQSLLVKAAPSTTTLTRALAIWFPRTCAVCERVSSLWPFCHRCALPPPVSNVERCVRCYAPTLLSSPHSPCLDCIDEGVRSCRVIAYERFLWHYEARVRDALCVMKYRPHLGLARWFASRLSEAARACFPPRRWTGIVSIPAHPVHVAQRQFDQGIVFAQQLAKDLNLPLYTSLIEHRVEGKSQAQTLHRARFHNSTATLRLVRRCIPGSRLLLVDDICTTGASATVAARLLRASGAAQVDFLSVARAHAWQEYRLTRRSQQQP